MKKFKYYTKPNFTIVEAELLNHPKLGIGYRPDTSDKTMLSECLLNYSILEIDSNDSILDLGANIGGFSKMMLEFNPKHIICVEPDEFNFGVLDYNICGPNVTKYEAAVVSSDISEVTFQIKDNNNNACSAKIGESINSKLYKSKTVKCVKFDYLLEKYQPTVIKMDIEGAEYDTIIRSLPAQVNQLALELHGPNMLDYLKMFKMLEYLLLEWEIILFDPIMVFSRLQLINVVFKRKKVLNIKYDYTEINFLNIRKFEFDRLPHADIKNNPEYNNLIIDHIEYLNNLIKNKSETRNINLLNF